MTFKSLILAAGLILLGAGCNLTPTATLDLPTTPPDAMMEKTDDAMMEDDSMMEKTDIDDDSLGDTGTERLDTDDDDDGILTTDDAMEKDGDAMMSDDAMEDDAMMDNSSSKKPYYIAYTSEVAEAAMAEGRPVVYYFWAAWCPICKAEEPTIKGWIETSEHPVAGFRVNYDTESALKAKYKVPYQHTTVFLNAKGVEVERFNGAVTEDEFRAALAKASL